MMSCDYRSPEFVRRDFAFNNYLYPVANTVLKGGMPRKVEWCLEPQPHGGASPCNPCRQSPACRIATFCMGFSHGDATAGSTPALSSVSHCPPPWGQVRRLELIHKLHKLFVALNNSPSAICAGTQQKLVTQRGPHLPK